MIIGYSMARQDTFNTFETKDRALQFDGAAMDGLCFIALPNTLQRTRIM